MKKVAMCFVAGGMGLFISNGDPIITWLFFIIAVILAYGREYT